jgi:hypothetical protein
VEADIMYGEVKKGQADELVMVDRLSGAMGHDYKQVENPQPVFHSQRRKSGMLRGFSPLSLEKS